MLRLFEVANAVPFEVLWQGEAILSLQDDLWKLLNTVASGSSSSSLISIIYSGGLSWEHPNPHWIRIADHALRDEQNKRLCLVKKVQP